MGGIPFYMNFFNPSYSLAQNIDALFFARNAKLGDEFERLFNSVFDNAVDWRIYRQKPNVLSHLQRVAAL